MFKYVNSCHSDPKNSQEVAKVTNHVLEVEDKSYLENSKNLKMKKIRIFFKNVDIGMRISLAVLILIVLYEKKIENAAKIDC